MAFEHKLIVIMSEYVVAAIQKWIVQSKGWRSILVYFQGVTSK